jgi:uncharacterized protein (UPF0548 family)
VARRSTDRSGPLNYEPVGGTRAADLLSSPPRGYRSSEHRGRLGRGEDRFESAVASLLAWGVQRGAGLRVADLRQAGADHPASRSDAPPITAGTSVLLLLPVGPFRLRAPARVVYVIDEPDRVGFAYGTLTGNPISGEESFVVERTDSGDVWLVLREFSRPSTWFWRLGTPGLRIAQRRMAMRYLRALNPAAGD